MSIPLDVITEIMSLLPVKSLLRFRCLSKQFCASIDSPEFIKLHLSRSKETYSKSSLTLHSNSGFFSASMDSLDNAVELLDHPLDNFSEKPIKVFGCCNGLLALQSLLGKGVYLLNPSTKKHKILPDIVIDSESHNNITRYYDQLGFGYDASTDDYKLVRIIMSSKQVFVYSLKTNSWKRVQDFPYPVDSLKITLRGGGALVGGALNWVDLAWDCFPLHIIAFDLKNEMFLGVPLHDDMEDTFVNNLSVLGGCLSMACLNMKNNGSEDFDIWSMKEYGVKESWTKLFSISPKIGIDSVSYKYLKVIAYSKYGNEVLLRLDTDYFCWYNLEEQSAEKIQFHGLIQQVWDTNICVESLVSPHVNIRHC